MALKMVDDTPVSERIDSTALFNKLSGAYFSVTNVPIDQSQHNTEFFEARSVFFDFTKDIIVGNLIVNGDGTYTDAFSVVPQVDAPEPIHERNLNMQAEQKITKKYPLVTQLNLLTKAVNRLGKEHDLLETEEFQALNEMVSYINQCIQTNQAKKEFFANHPDVEYYSDERLAEEQLARLEGGVHEWLGPRTIDGGFVFGTDRR